MLRYHIELLINFKIFHLQRFIFVFLTGFDLKNQINHFNSGFYNFYLNLRLVSEGLSFIFSIYDFQPFEAKKQNISQRNLLWQIDFKLEIYSFLNFIFLTRHISFLFIA